jgi:hypothetical protein
MRVNQLDPAQIKVGMEKALAEIKAATPGSIELPVGTVIPRSSSLKNSKNFTAPSGCRQTDEQLSELSFPKRHSRARYRISEACSFAASTPKKILLPKILTESANLAIGNSTKSKVTRIRLATTTVRSAASQSIGMRGFTK